MANTNLDPADKFLLQRGELSYVAYAQDLLNFQRDDISDILSGVESELSTEIENRVEGDQILTLALNSYRDYIRIGVDALFPSLFQVGLDYIRTPVQNSTYNNSINVCKSGIDGTLTGDELEAAETNCYYDAVKAVYADLDPDEFNQHFGFLNTSSVGRYDQAHTLIADNNSPVEGSLPITWEGVNKDDFLMVSELDSEGKPSDTKYALYKVIKNLNKDFVQDGTLEQIPGIHMLQILWEGGDKNAVFNQSGKRYSVRVMTDFRTELDGDYISKNGDTVLGNLEFSNSQIILKGDVTADKAILFNEESDQTILKPHSNLILKVGTGTGVTFHNDGKVSGVVTPVNTELTNVVNVGYVVSEVNTINSSIDQVASDLVVVDQRIDAIAKILDQFNFTQKTTSTSDVEDTWITETVDGLSDGDLDFFDKTLSDASAQTIIFSGATNDQGLVILTSLSEDDVFEFVCTDGSSQSFIYKITTFETVTNGFQVAANLIYKFGEPSLQEGKSYKLKYYASANGITLEEANLKFLDKQSGGIVTGPLELKSGDETETQFKITNVDSGISYTFHRDNGVVLASTDLETGIKLSVSSGGDYTLKLRYDGVFADSSLNNGFNVYVGDSSSPQFTVKTTEVDVHNNRITNVGLATTETDVVNVNYYNTKLFKRFIAGSGIFMSEDTSRVITISTTNNSEFSVASANDVRSGFSDGDTLIWDNTESRFVSSSVSSIIKGQNLMVTSEAEAEVGGMWTDGTNYFIKVS